MYRACHRLLLPILILAAASVGLAAPRTVQVSLADGSAPIRITIDGGRIQISAGPALALTGDTKDGQKRRYTGKGGTIVSEVRMGEPDGFKVRTPDGRLLWKVRTSDGKTKVSDNEENRNPYELAVKGTSVRVSKDARLLATFEFGPAVESAQPGLTTIKDANGNRLGQIEPASRSIAAGVVVLPGISLEHRAIIMAELLARAP